MFGGIKFYDDKSKSNNELEEATSSDNSIYVVKNNNTIGEEFELKHEYFDKWKNYSNNDDEYKSSEIIIEENNNKKEESDFDIRDNESVYSEYDLENKNEKINENDDDEDTEDKLYVISLDGSPHFYESTLVSARSTMWKIANKLLKSKNEYSFYDENNNYIFTNSLNKVSLISPYNFFGLKYHYTICELEIDYVIRYDQ